MASYFHNWVRCLLLLIGQNNACYLSIDIDKMFTITKNNVSKKHVSIIPRGFEKNLFGFILIRGWTLVMQTRRSTIVGRSKFLGLENLGAHWLLRVFPLEDASFWSYSHHPWLRKESMIFSPLNQDMLDMETLRRSSTQGQKFVYLRIFPSKNLSNKNQLWRSAPFRFGFLKLPLAWNFSDERRVFEPPSFQGASG